LKYKILSICLCIVLLGSWSCFESRDLAEERAYRAKHAQSDQKILVGAVAPWQQKHSYRKGLELARQEINKQGVLGREIKLIWKDDNASLSKSRRIAQNLSENPEIVSVIGHYSSGRTLPVSLMYQHYGVLLITGKAASTKITDREGMDLVFQNVPNTRQAARQYADFCQNRYYRRMIIFNVNTSFGKNMANTFQKRCNRMGIDILDHRSFDPSAGSVQIKDRIKRWKEIYKFDALFFSGRPPATSKFIKQCRKMGLDIPIVVGGALDPSLGGNYIEGVLIADYFHPDEPRKKVQDFVRDFHKHYGKTPDSNAAQGYLTLNILVRAMRQANTTVPSRVADTLDNMDKYNGVTGKISFGKQGQQEGDKLVMEKVQNQKFEYLKTINSSVNNNGTSQFR